MKKILFIIVLLLTPFMVKAYLSEGEIVFYFGDESESYYDYWTPIERIGYIGAYDSTSEYQYSRTYEYVDGVYNLTGTIKKHGYKWLIEHDPDFKNAEILYTCASETETSCEQLRVVFTQYKTAVNYKGTTLRIQNGETVDDIRYYTIGNSFEKVGDKYRLVDTFQYDISTVLSTRNDIVGKYICADKKSTECDELHYINSVSGRSLLVNSTAKIFKYGKNYEYKNGKYILKDVVEEDWWPDYSNIEGYYSCLTDSIECTNMVYIKKYIPRSLAYNYEFIELYEGEHFDMINLTYETEVLEVPVGGVVLGTKYFTNINNVQIMDSSVLKLEGDKFVPLKVGDTFLIEQTSDGKTMVLHVFVTQEMLDAYNALNPKTKTGIMIAVSTVFTLLLVVAFMVKKKKYN